MSFSGANTSLWREYKRIRMGMCASGGGGVGFWQRLWWLAHVWIKLTSKMPRAIDKGFVFQLLPKQSWTIAVLEGKQYPFQLQKWQALCLFMLCSVCFVFISVLLLERLLETACTAASCSPQRQAGPSPPASRALPSGAQAQQWPGPQLNWKILIEEKN